LFRKESEKPENKKIGCAGYNEVITREMGLTLVFLREKQI